MCVSLWQAELLKTLGLTAKNGDFHRLGYQNVAKNLDDGPNAMLLPIPALEQPVLLDTTSCPTFLKDMDKSTRRVTRSLSFDAPIAKGGVAVFDFDVYTIVLAANAILIPTALYRVPESRRPKPNHPQFNAYGKWYDEFWFALCCFNNKDAQQALPLLWQYAPLWPNIGFFPGLDEHDGGVPDLSKQVMRDHLIFAASDTMVGGKAVTYTNETNIKPALRSSLPDRVFRFESSGSGKNRDWIVDFNEVGQAYGEDPHFRLKEVLPPNA